MKFIVAADDTGSLKEVICSRGTDTSKQDAVQPKSIKNYRVDTGNSFRNKITKLVNFQSTYLIGARVGGEVSIYDLVNEEETPEEEKYSLLHTYKLDVDQKDKPVSLIKLSPLDSILIAFESSKVFIIHFQGDEFDYAPIPVTLPSTKSINAFVANPNVEGVFAYGGQENDLQIIKLYEQPATGLMFNDKVEFKPKVLFNAKNVKNDHLDLRVPVWISNILFLKDAPTPDAYKVLTSTRYGQLRIYDTTHGRRPVKDYKICEKAIVAMTFGDEQQESVIVTDVHNLIGKYSLIKEDEKALKIHSASAGDVVRPVLKLLGKFSQGGNTGATHALENAEDEVLVAGGLDRYLRVFDIETRDILAKVYLGVEVLSVLVDDLEDEEEEVEEGAEKKITIQRKRRRDIEKAEESDEEEMWSKLDEKKSKR
ncbi:uncharacterized protein CANTADRAFT_24693 [Suhomyces tanzawaensis NRRL Y-17324]|uniref:Ribosome biogenesis protein NSA1 n=1 Tax=Suhomyces tanzawaensis NRRL Y-17324 TaxID=984487 RepID=A0A1E4SR54_9ASCO|nr:uncharacterized protein CANTADRAFT_24693 [Suhomyces tanzawaensis NRRL Y-17324]ODV81990.1 hypothetical protein CANTADRAFT_24693 [Suhomyces tanzawaensis NRRL Y-17324]